MGQSNHRPEARTTTGAIHFSNMEPTQGLYWLMTQIAMMTEFATIHPLNRWLVKRDIKEEGLACPPPSPFKKRMSNDSNCRSDGCRGRRRPGHRRKIRPGGVHGRAVVS
ncbi:MAG: DUF4396 domain-containing protein [Janthinobacterium lividum]